LSGLYISQNNRFDQLVKEKKINIMRINIDTQINQIHKEIHMGIIVRVPAIPESLYRSVQSQVGWFKKKTNLLRWEIKAGDWVEKGQVIARYDVKNSWFRSNIYAAIILAPFAGEILNIMNRDYADWVKSDGSIKSGDDFSTHDILFVIKPSSDLEEIYPDFIAGTAMYYTYISLAIFTESAKIPNNGSMVVHAKAKVEIINS
jgi:hypothetical protein